jgi:ribonuclease HI
MGFAFTITNNITQNKVHFSGTTINYPSSTRAELTAILTAIATCPPTMTIDLFTDSAAAIMSIQSKKKHREKQGNNQKITQKIIDLITDKHLSITWNKVKAHSNNPHNDEVDHLAKQQSNQSTDTSRNITINTTNERYPSITTFLGNHLIECPNRKIAKLACQAKWSYKWKQLNRNQSIDFSNIDWQKSMSSLHPTPITDNTTNSEDHRNRSFNLRLKYQELPTKEKLYNRKPQIYKDPLCINCGDPENSTHPFLCKKNGFDIIKQTTFIFGKEISARINNKLDESMETIAVERAELNKTNTIQHLILGFIPIKLINTVQGILKDKHKTQECITSFLKDFRHFLLQIWQVRCKEFVEWEIKNGISKKTKQKSKYQNHKNSHQSHTNSSKEINNNVLTFLDNHIINGYNLYNIFSTSGAVAR